MGQWNRIVGQWHQSNSRQLRHFKPLLFFSAVGHFADYSSRIHCLQLNPVGQERQDCERQKGAIDTEIMRPKIQT